MRQTLVAVDRTSRLVRQLLAMSELDAVPDEGEPQDILVGPALKEVIASLGRGATRVEIDPALHRTTIWMNRELFHLAVRNLHENAVQHSPEGGLVRWFLDSGTSPPVIAVEDEGPGIPEDEIGQVTDRFFRGRHRSAVGSGLGLAIVDAALGGEGIFRPPQPAGPIRTAAGFGIDGATG